MNHFMEQELAPIIPRGGRQLTRYLDPGGLGMIVPASHVRVNMNGV